MVRCTFSPARAWRPAVVARLARTLGVILVAHKYFYDLPVYRVARDHYYKERAEHIENVIFPLAGKNNDALRKLESEKPGLNDFLRNHLEKSYGGQWEFNEVIGYIRLHFLGTQVRGEYYAPSKKRIVRTRTKTLEFQTWKLAPEVDIELPVTNTTIRKAISEYIEACRKEVPRRFIDTGLFEAVSPHVDWLSFLRHQ